jgi:hypothetical protein
VFKLTTAPFGRSCQAFSSALLVNDAVLAGAALTSAISL